MGTGHGFNAEPQLDTGPTRTNKPGHQKSPFRFRELSSLSLKAFSQLPFQASFAPLIGSPGSIFSSPGVTLLPKSVS